MNSASQPQSDMVQFYDQPDFSDMTIKFGEKEIKAHRIILCARSVYFKKALGPNSPFQESQTGTYSLQEDDALAVECMLHYLYSLHYALTETDASDTQQTWERHLNVAIVADKYDVPGLEECAFGACARELHEEEDREFDVPHLINRAGDYHDRSGKLERLTLAKVNAQLVSLLPRADIQAWLADRPKVREALIIQHFDDLMENETFRGMLRKDGEMALQHLDRLHSEAMQGSGRFAYGSKGRKGKKFHANFGFNSYDDDMSLPAI